MIKRIARVVDNMDELQQGRCKLQILPEFAQLDEAVLPWVRPRNVGVPYTSPTGVGSHKIPPMDSYVEVEITENWQKFYYGAPMAVANTFYPYATAMESFNVPDVDTPEYPQPDIIRKEDGTLHFHNTETGEQGIQHPSGTYVAIDKDGNLFIRTVKTCTLSAKDEAVKAVFDGEAGEINMEGGTFNFTLDEFVIGDGADSIVLFTPLEEILKALLKHVHTAPSGPTLPAEDSGKIPLEALLASKIPKIKSQKVTSD